MHRRSVLLFAVLIGFVGAAGLVTARLRIEAADARMRRPAYLGPDEIWDPVPQSMAPWPDVAHVSSILLAVGLGCAIAVAVGAVIVGRRRARRQEPQGRAAVGVARLT